MRTLTARGMHIAAGRVAVVGVILIAWGVSASVAGPHHLAGPFAVLQHLVETARSGLLVQHVLATLRLSAGGFAVGCAAGAVLPLLLLPLPRVIAAVEPFIVASAGIPKYAVVPLLILWFGIDAAPKVCLVGLLAFYPVFIGVLTGTRQVDRQLLHMARIAGASTFAIVRLVAWPSMLPFLFSSLRIAVPRAVSGAIVGELLIGDEGIGYLIESARQSLDTAGVLAGVAIATVLVAMTAAVVRHIERQALAWRQNEYGLPD